MIRDVIQGEELLTRSHAIGQYYGFTPLTTLTDKARGTTREKDTTSADLSSFESDPMTHAVIGFLKQCQLLEYTPSHQRPLFLWHTNLAAGRPAKKRAIVQFHALGSDRAIAEAVVIRAVLALARDLFSAEPVVRINSMGDKETRARYVRELGAFFKRRSAMLPADYLECAKRDAIEAVELVYERMLFDDAPAPTEHLSDASRKRFEDLLEYLEMTETPYELARDLLSRAGAWSDICFEVLVDGERVAWGSRYNDLTRHFFKEPFPAFGAVLHATSEGDVVKKNPTARYNVSFIHIGDEAKRISIRLAEDFKKARLPLTQSIGTESLAEQLALAERRESPYLLIMGRKEALEGIAILRNRQTQEETILPLDGIAERLRALV